MSESNISPLVGQQTAGVICAPAKEQVDGGERPLVSYLLLACDHERFVGEAVRSALAQTYCPLEILLSDDCSSDRTFEVIQKTAAGYNGPHILCLNRNQKRLGLAQHLNRLTEMATGELLIIASGDDVSHHERTERIVSAWVTNGRPDALVSDLSVIDADGNIVRSKWGGQLASPLSYREAIISGECSLIGCAGAYHRNLFKLFGPLDPAILQEDVALAFRALLNRGILIVPECLVAYRDHGGNLFLGKRNRRKSNSREAARWAESWAAITHDWQRSLERSGVATAQDQDMVRRLCLYRDLDVKAHRCSRIELVGVLLTALVGRVPKRFIIRLAKNHLRRHKT